MCTARLSALPPLPFPALKNLDISHNQIVNLPPGIGQLVCLEVLIASHNQLTCLPTSLGSALVHLELAHNSITELPEELAQACCHIEKILIAYHKASYEYKLKKC